MITMKAPVLGILAGVGLVIAAIGIFDHRGEALAQQSAPARVARSGGDLIVVPAPVGEKAQLITVIDPKLRVMNVYKIDLATGKIALLSVRNINWDLQMMYLNNESPLPHEIRTLLEQR